MSECFVSPCSSLNGLSNFVTQRSGTACDGFARRRIQYRHVKRKQQVEEAVQLLRDEFASQLKAHRVEVDNQLDILKKQFLHLKTNVLDVSALDSALDRWGDRVYLCSKSDTEIINKNAWRVRQELDVSSSELKRRLLLLEEEVAELANFDSDNEDLDCTNTCDDYRKEQFSGQEKVDSSAMNAPFTVRTRIACADCNVPCRDQQTFNLCCTRDGNSIEVNFDALPSIDISTWAPFCHNCWPLGQQFGIGHHQQQHFGDGKTQHESDGTAASSDVCKLLLPDEMAWLNNLFSDCSPILVDWHQV